MDVFAHTTNAHAAPGTVTIEDVENNKVILQPQPSPDPEQPLNWSKIRKSINYFIVCLYALFTFVLLDIGTVVWLPMNEELGISYQNLINSFAANLAGLAVGCIFLIPLAVIYGRRPVYIISTLVQFGTGIWQAKARNAGDLLGANALSGFAGAVSESIVQMTISDLFFVHQRATMNSIYVAMVLAGSFLGPIAAGYCAQSQGWPWIWWWTAIFLAITALVQIFIFEETKFIPRLPSSQSRNSTDEDGTSTLETRQDRKDNDDLKKGATQSIHAIGYSKKTWRERLAWYTLTPGGTQSYFKIVWECVVLLRFPAVSYTAIIYGSSLAWFSVLLNTLSVYFTLPPYNFGTSAIGLLNLAPFIGGILAIILGSTNDWIILWAAKRNGGVFEPEMRLWLGMIGVITAPAGMLLFGLTMANGSPWIIPAVGAAIFGFGFSLISDVSLTYLQDCYSEVVGRALVSVSFVRNAFSMMIVFVLTPWINTMGLKNMFICASCLAWAMYFTTLPMAIWGGKWRAQTGAAYRKMIHQAEW